MKTLLICLEMDGRVLHEVRSDSFSGPIGIGRSRDCAWSVSGVDPSMSAHHAEIFAKGRALWLRDLGSRNGILCAGERVECKKLRPGDKFHLGACILVVEEIREKDTRDLLPYHRLEQLNGPDAGRVLELCGTDDVTIGSDPSSSLLCLDPLVSREHAALSIKADGSVWVRDCGSRNGTSVNGTALAKDKERMLRDGDVLSVAYIEFRFTDKNVAHPRAHLLRKIGIAAATVAVTMIGYYAYASARPSARSFLGKSVALAATGRFDEAAEMARASANARGADAYARRRAELLQSVEAWRTTTAAWNEMRQLLNAGDWDRAQEVSVRLSDWNWNSSDGPQEGVRATRALELVRALRDAQRALAEGADMDGLTGAEDALKAARAAFEASDCTPPGTMLPWAARLLSDGAAVAPELATTKAELRSIVETLDSLAIGRPGSEPLAARRALAALETIRDSNAVRGRAPADGEARPFRPSPIVAARIGEMSAPLKALAESERAFMSNVEKIAAAQFDDLRRELPLPSDALLGLHPAFPLYAEALRELNGALCGPVCLGWKSRLESIVALGLDPVSGKRPLAIRAVLSSVTAADVLKFVPSPALVPARSDDDRPVAGCDYDAFVGIFDFYYFLEELDPDESPDRAVDAYGNAGGSFDSTVEMARAVCAKLRTFRDYAEKASGDIGALARMVAFARDVPGGNRIGLALSEVKRTLDDVEDWSAVDFPARCAAEGGERAKILGSGVRLLFEARPDRDRAARLAADWRAFKRSLPKWDGTDESSRELFDKALPGMSQHRNAWGALHKAAAAHGHSPGGAQ